MHVAQNDRYAPTHVTLPTPVGPRNRNDAIGREGFCKPARLRRTASETAYNVDTENVRITWIKVYDDRLLAVIASSCPTTRLLKTSSI